MSPTDIRDFLCIPYDQLEEMNLQVKQERLDRVSAGELEERRRHYLAEEKRIKAITVCFTDLEGRFHMIDYDKKHLLKAGDNLTFDGSSIRGFTVQKESDLILHLDWGAFWWLPSDVFGPGKVILFAEVYDRDGTPYHADFRSQLKHYCAALFERHQQVAHVAAEIEGFLFRGRDAERRFFETPHFEFISTGGYYHSLPQDPLRQFIDRAAEAQRAMGFENDKDHPEVAPSQFEMNFSFSDALIIADEIQLYKLVCRQVAQSLDMTASFLPKPVVGINGSGMHTNISISRRGENLFYDNTGEDGLSRDGWEFIERILYSANDICLILNSSVNSYRRLDPHYEAPNQIKVSAVNRGAMIRIPLANKRSARIEVRSVAPDANPYLLIYTLLKTGLEGPISTSDDSDAKRPRTRFLHSNIHDAIRSFRGSEVVHQFLGEQAQSKFAELKQASADRCPKELGSLVKIQEIMFHHEVTNQYLWSKF
ncbi:MAG: Glutamine synthetase [Phycisphaerae bacterium]|nr:Glutamine synthetase [Phycisphaerae bacterium]